MAARLYARIVGAPAGRPGAQTRQASWKAPVADPFDITIPGVTAAADEHAVLVRSAEPLALLSSAVVGGGLCRARAIVNLHVDKDYDGHCPEDDLAAFAARHGVEAPFVGLMTAACTDHSRVATEARDGLAVAAVVSMGLSNTTCAGVTPPLGAGPSPGTINAILLIDGRLSEAAMVNAVICATEAKALALAAWDVRAPQGEPASGTSTDAVVIACTGRGPGLSYAGPATTAGWLVARTVRGAMEQICREKIERDGGRRLGW